MTEPELNFIIETQYGCYPLGSWCFVTSRSTLSEAVEFCREWGEEYRVVDSSGKVLYPYPQQENESG